MDLILQGDLNQMVIQKTQLSLIGVDMYMNNVYPVVKEKDVEKALTYIWINKLKGWWHYKNEYLKFNICTKEQFKQGFKNEL